MSLYSYSDYRRFLIDHIAKLPKKGRGELSRMAHELGVHSTLMSLILSGERELTLEQAYDLAAYLQFTEMENEYFVLLVQFQRAGNHRYKAHVKKKIEEIRAESAKISNRFEHESKLSEEQRSLFYSSWIYSAIRLFTDTKPVGVSVEDIAERFRLNRPQVMAVLEFLLSCGLVKQNKDLYQMGTQRTFLEQGSPHLIKHHSNWRIKAVQKADRVSNSELMFTSPMSLSKQDFELIREDLAELLKKISKVVKDSSAEEIACLNIDMFWIDS